MITFNILQNIVEILYVLQLLTDGVGCTVLVLISLGELMKVVSKIET